MAEFLQILLAIASIIIVGALVMGFIAVIVEKPLYLKRFFSEPHQAEWELEKEFERRAIRIMKEKGIRFKHNEYYRCSALYPNEHCAYCLAVKEYQNEMAEADREMKKK